MRRSLPGRLVVAALVIVPSGSILFAVERVDRRPPCQRRRSHTPSPGPPATTVTITGDNPGGATAVDFNGTPATISYNGQNKIVVTVPAGATSGHFTVTTPAGTAISGQIFTVT
jgi:hypothetical protein